LIGFKRGGPLLSHAKICAKVDYDSLRYYEWIILKIEKEKRKWRYKTMRLVPYLRRPEYPSTTRLFEEFFNDFPFNETSGTRENWVPTVDILEKDGNLILRAELPGMTEKDIDLKLEGNTLILKGERKLDNEDKKNNYHRIESFYGSFTRSFRLPETVDQEKIGADYKNGVLTVTLPQKPEVRPREIPVSVQ
jgi:HSP20 family protein